MGQYWAGVRCFSAVEYVVHATMTGAFYCSLFLLVLDFQKGRVAERNFFPHVSVQRRDVIAKRVKLTATTSKLTGTLGSIPFSTRR